MPILSEAASSPLPLSFRAKAHCRKARSKGSRAEADAQNAPTALAAQHRLP